MSETRTADVPVRILLRDIETGEEGWHEYATTADRLDDPDDDEGFYWTDGNGSCDCERARCLAATFGRPDPNASCGDSRIRIIAATVGGVPRPWEDKQ